MEDSMLITKIGLVDTTGTLKPESVAEVAAALNVQVTRDVPQYWNVSAAVSYLTDPTRVPQGVWPVQLVKHLPPGEGGFHLTKHNQPYAKVIASPDNLDWSIDASHEIIEMLVDPSGNRFQTSAAIKIDGDGVADTDGRYEYLVEACDPCEGNEFAYQIDGISVSDFLTPHFYDTSSTSGARYSFTGAITRPRELLKGGYISFLDPKTNELKQILWVEPGPPQPNTLGPASAAGVSIRAFADGHSREKLHKLRTVETPKTAARARQRPLLNEAALVRAKLY
jgi:hypothetical protein